MSELQDETWRDVVGAEGFYEVSDHGRIRRVGGRVLRQFVDSRGYATLTLCLGPKGTRQVRVHKVVAEAFIGPANGLEVNHRDGRRLNNRATNLEYLTHAENLRHATESGLRHAKPRLNPQAVAVIRHLVSAGRSRQLLADLHGVGRQAIEDVVSRKTWAREAGPDSPPKVTLACCPGCGFDLAAERRLRRARRRNLFELDRPHGCQDDVTINSSEAREISRNLRQGREARS